MSLALLDVLLDDNYLDFLDDGGGRQIVKDMIHNPARGSSSKSVLWDDSNRRFLFEIVANDTTGIDTDKFDYIARDAYSLGMHSSFDRNRLLYSSRWIRHENWRAPCYPFTSLPCASWSGYSMGGSPTTRKRVRNVCKRRVLSPAPPPMLPAPAPVMNIYDLFQTRYRSGYIYRRGAQLLA